MENVVGPRDPADAGHDREALELHAYNAAFHALGLRWHWDRAAYAGLMKDVRSPADGLRLYLSKHQPHLLRAYDAEFLIAAIEAKKASCVDTLQAAGKGACGFDWAESCDGELGA